MRAEREQFERTALLYAQPSDGAYCVRGASNTLFRFAKRKKLRQWCKTMRVNPSIPQSREDTR